eukprot:COSAG01_NODE_62774_length_283_cov_0.543478_1_plen_46_part_01
MLPLSFDLRQCLSVRFNRLQAIRVAGRISRGQLSDGALQELFAAID